MLLLIKKLDSKFAPFLFVLSHSDVTSTAKILASASTTLDCDVSWHKVHRSREVKQSWVSTVFTTAWACVQSFDLVCRTQPATIVANGPGTCVPLCYSAWLLGWLVAPFTSYLPKIVFVESFCRVQRLSLTGRLLYPIADRFLVQWPQLAAKHKRAVYLGDAKKLLH